MNGDRSNPLPPSAWCDCAPGQTIEHVVDEIRRMTIFRCLGCNATIGVLFHEIKEIKIQGTIAADETTVARIQAAIENIEPDEDES